MQQLPGDRIEECCGFPLGAAFCLSYIFHVAGRHSSLYPSVSPRCCGCHHLGAFRPMGGKDAIFLCSLASRNTLHAHAHAHAHTQRDFVPWHEAMWCSSLTMDTNEVLGCGENLSPRRRCLTAYWREEATPLPCHAMSKGRLAKTGRFRSSGCELNVPWHPRILDQPLNPLFLLVRLRGDGFWRLDQEIH